MKKLFLTLLVSLCIITGCETKETDASKFKNEYESLNGEVAPYGVAYRKLEIKQENPFIYVTDTELVEKFENEESFVVYFGFSACPWCRSIIPSLIDVAASSSIDKIYYLDVYEIRDTLTVNEEGKIETSKQGSEGYYKLLEKMDNVLSDYELTHEDKVVETNEKRIYAPNVVIVKNGEAISLTTGVSEKQTDAFMTLTDEIKKDTESMFKKIFDEYLNENSSCSLDKGC